MEHLLCATSYCFHLAVSRVLLTWIPTYLMTVRGFSIISMGLVSSALWGGTALWNLMAEYTSDHFLSDRHNSEMIQSALDASLMMYQPINSPAEHLSYYSLSMHIGMVLRRGSSTYTSYPTGLASKSTFPVANAILNMIARMGLQQRRFCPVCSSITAAGATSVHFWPLDRSSASAFLPSLGHSLSRAGIASNRALISASPT